ncbi:MULTISPECIES: histidinol-phosphate transaminase [unclassified Clostridium]|uniref:histidinol-phosphate transaminase n=1 Tax=unclassified Clostridium TaxID=2614128 RepID=UPI00029857D2|nr:MULTISPECIES: histidinol-phosphate transaminase [unclassified Clostridium]EKQ58117.1 MAG: histidinol-phosphate aminotransferase [Clostridium sp. Maddingley MBC34-26]
MSNLKHREELDSIENYKPAKTIESISRELGLTKVIKLAGNENRFGCSKLAKEAIKNAFDEISLYPDFNLTCLRERLSNDLNVKENQIIFGNGSFELLSLIAQAFINKGEESIIPEITFGWYQTVTLQMGGNIVFVPLKEYQIDLDEIKSKINRKTKVIWICNPNNPIGTFIDEKKLVKFLEDIPKDIVVVLDEAYYEYVDDSSYPESINLLNNYKNIIVLRTFSKVYGLASLRLGYGIASEEVIDCLSKVKEPINVNMAAQVAALASLDDYEFKNRVLENNKISKQLYYEELDKLNLEYIKTQGNFIMINTNISGDLVVEKFLKRGILIRSGSEFKMPSWVRISIGTYEENIEVLNALKEILN